MSRVVSHQFPRFVVAVLVSVSGGLVWGRDGQLEVSGDDSWWGWVVMFAGVLFTAWAVQDAGPRAAQVTSLVPVRVVWASLALAAATLCVFALRVDSAVSSNGEWSDLLILIDESSSLNPRVSEPVPLLPDGPIRWTENPILPHTDVRPEVLDASLGLGWFVSVVSVASALVVLGCTSRREHDSPDDERVLLHN